MLRNSKPIKREDKLVGIRVGDEVDSKLKQIVARSISDLSESARILLKDRQSISKRPKKLDVQA